jgi:hypothetical protein
MPRPASPAHPTFLKQDGRHRFLICIVATMVQQCNLRTRGGHFFFTKMRDELGLAQTALENGIVPRLNKLMVGQYLQSIYVKEKLLKLICRSKNKNPSLWQTTSSEWASCCELGYLKVLFLSSARDKAFSIS